MSKITLTPLTKGLVAAFVFCTLSITASYAQIFFNNGAQIYTAPAAIIKVNGGIENNSSISNGDIDHNGTMTVTLNSTFPNPGDVTLNNNSVWHGNGRTLVEGDWVNNSTFQPDLSYVELYASTVQQQITGTVSTTFHKLKLTGTGVGPNRIKLQTLDASVDSLMDVTNRELATDIHSMFILNADPSIVINDSTQNAEGFVSSLAPGVLSRVTNTMSSYNYPVGSSVVSTRYRPVRIAPNASSAGAYTVRFINHNADNDTYNRSMNDGILCQAIDTFYHAILRTAGNNPADIKLYYRPTSDGNWSGMSHWQTSTSIMWHDMAVVAPGSNTNGFTTVDRASWLFANAGDPYILTQLRPAAPVIVCPTICQNGNGTFTVTGNGNYTWVTPNGTTINSGQGTNTINVSWGSTGGTVYVIDTTNGSACASLPDSCVITPMPAPIAGFDTLSMGGYATSYQFTDTSQGGTTWYWNFGDNNTSTAQNPSHQYAGAGTYCVLEVVTNAAGCVDSSKVCMDVKEEILIPNVFTPDGDGINDEFWIPSSGFETFAIEIFNRWGTKIWEASAGEIRWDGHSFSGQMMSDGTYYFVLKATLKTKNVNSTLPKDYNVKGFVTLLTKKK